MEEEKKIEVAETPAEEVPAQEASTEEQAPKKKGDHFVKKGGKGAPHKAKEDDGTTDRVVSINRVCKTVKGGRKMKFSALVVIGDGKGNYGFGTGKAAEVPDAIKKAKENAKKNTFKIHINKHGTISHEIIGKFGACSVFLKPAPEGTGIIAGGPVRAILELAGVKNVCSKVYGSRAPINIIRATNKGLESLHTYAEVRAVRGK